MATDIAEKILAKIEKLAEKEGTFLPIVGKAKGAHIEELIEKEKPRRILEIGALIGYSAIRMARHGCVDKLVSIEISAAAADIAGKNIEAAGLADKVEVRTGNALGAIPQLEGSFDLVFIDAAKEEYLAYLEALEKNGNIRSGTIVIADNAKLFAEHMADYLDYVRASPRYRSEYVDFGFDALEVSRRL